MRSIQDGRFIFLGDDAASVASAEFKDRFKTQYPKMKSVKREWIIQNKDALREPIKIVVAGGDYGASTLFNTLYDPYDYQLFRFVLIKTNQSADQLLGKPVLCDYFIREQSRTSVEFNTRAIVWDSLSLNESPNTFFSFGKVDILNFLSITSLFDKKTRILEYPYYEDSAIRAATYFDTTAVRFNYVREDSVLKFSFKTSIGVGALQVRLFVTDAIGKRKLLPASYIINPTGVTDTSKGSVPMAQREDADIKILEATEDDNPSNIPGSSRTPIKYIVRRKRPELQKFKEFKVAIPLQKPLDIQSRFLIEITDAIGQITTLPVRIKSRP